MRLNMSFSSFKQPRLGLSGAISSHSDMYPSNISHNGNDPIFYSDQPFCRRLFSNDSNTTSKQANDRAPTPPPPPPPSAFSHFPSSLGDNGIFLQQLHHDLLFHHQFLAEGVAADMEIAKKIPSKGHNISTEQIPRKKSGKRDRHSKISTARGLRDRRMRLSLEVAKRFFYLQDMLGFEKASKTVEWLLNHAKEEIKRLAREKNHLSCNSAGGKSASSTSECEGVSGLDEVAVSAGNGDQQEGEPSIGRKIKLPRKSAFHSLARESRVKAREMARERARERTKEKKRRKLADESKQCSEATDLNLSQLGSWNPLETKEESGTQSQIVNPSLDVLTEAEERSSQAKENLWTHADYMANDDSLVTMSKWSPSMIFNSLHNSGFQEHLFAEFQSWENIGIRTQSHLINLR